MDDWKNDFIRRSIERKKERNSRINGAMIRGFIKIARLQSYVYERWLYKKKKKEEYERNAIKLRSFQLWPSGEVNTRGKLDGLHERTARALKSGRRVREERWNFHGTSTVYGASVPPTFLMRPITQLPDTATYPVTRYPLSSLISSWLLLRVR